MGSSCGKKAIASLPEDGIGENAFMGFGHAENVVTVERLIEISRTLDVGDVVVFSNCDSVDTMAVEMSRWTHVGIVYKRDGVYCKSIDKWHEANAKGQQIDEVCLMEAYLLEEGETAPPDSGMNLTPLPWRIRKYLQPNGKGTYAIGVRRLLNVERTPELRKLMEEIWLEIKDRKYETDWWEKARSALDIADSASPDPRRKHTMQWSQNTTNEKELFCSELVAMTLMRFGVLASGPGHPPSNEYCPADYGEDRIQKNLKMLKGAAWSPLTWAAIK